MRYKVIFAPRLTDCQIVERLEYPARGGKAARIEWFLNGKDIGPVVQLVRMSRFRAGRSLGLSGF